MRALRLLAWTLAAVVLLALPYFVRNHVVMIVALIGVTAIITSGLTILTGMTGLISLAQASFCALGAYGATWMANAMGIPVWLSIPAACVLTAGIGYLLGWLTLRVEGHYLALVTLAFAGMVHWCLIHMTSITGGAVGMPVVPLSIGDFTFRSPKSLYYLSLSSVALIFLGLVNFGRSRWGRAFHALRQSEIAAQSLGLNTRRLKAAAFALSAALGAFGGALQALQSKYLDPVQFSILIGVSYMAVLVIGGLRVLPGALIGAALFVLVPEFLGGFRTYMGLLFALVLLVVLIVLPGGLGSLPGRLRQLRGKRGVA